MSEYPQSLTAALAGRYRIERELGRGGMGIVYLAHDVRHGRPVALKVLRPELAEAMGSGQFLREIEVAARLSHPHILPVHDSGDANGNLYYVMPYVEGESLGDRLRREQQLPIDEVQRIAREVADALEYAHGRGVLHRDIKPDNIMLQGGHAVIADFGIATAIGAALTDTGLAVGTPDYMSPEQINVEQPLGIQSDIYSLACVVCEMLIGEPPFTGGNAQAILTRKMVDAPPSLRAVRDTVPEHVEHAVLKALSKVPADRFATAAQFAQALRLTSEKVVGRWWRAAAVSAAVVAVAVIIATSWPTDDGSMVPLVDNRVVVGLIANRTGDSNLDDLGTMAIDWITQGLQQMEPLDVIPTPTALQASQFVSSNRRARRGRDPVRSLANETGARIVVSGAYYADGDTLRFQLQVSDAVSGGLVGALGPERGSLSAAGELVDRMRERLTGFLAVTFDERLAKNAGFAQAPPTIAAYRAFARGMEYYLRNEGREALRHFYEAYELDTTFVVALLYAALNHSNLREWAEADTVLRTVADRQRHLSDYHRHWLEYRRAFVAGDNDRALRAVRRAAAIAPGSKAVYNLAVQAMESGRIHEGLRTLGQLQPDRGPMRGWLPYWWILADGHHLLGNHDREWEVAKRSRELFPNRLSAVALEVRAAAARGNIEHFATLLEEAVQMRPDGGGFTPAIVLQTAAEELRAHGFEEAAHDIWEWALTWYDAQPEDGANRPEMRWGRANALRGLGRWQDAKDITESLVAEFPDNIEYHGLLGILAARLDDREGQRAALEWLATHDAPYTYGSSAQYQASIAAIAGTRDRAVASLRESFARGRAYGLWLHRDITFETLRDYPPFISLAKPKG